MEHASKHPRVQGGQGRNWYLAGLQASSGEGGDGGKVHDSSSPTPQHSYLVIPHQPQSLCGLLSYNGLRGGYYHEGWPVAASGLPSAPSFLSPSTPSHSPPGALSPSHGHVELGHHRLHSVLVCGSSGEVSGVVVRGSVAHASTAVAMVVLHTSGKGAEMCNRIHSGIAMAPVWE